MLPQRREIANVVVCEDDTTTLELLCDNLVADRFGVLPAPTASDALRLCRYKQPGPDAARPDPPRRLGARRAAGDPRSRRHRLALRPAPAGDRPQRPRRRRRSRARPRVRGRRLRGQALRLLGTAGADRGGPAAGGPAHAAARCGSATSSSTRAGDAPGSAGARCICPRRSSRCCGCSPSDPHRVFSKRELLGEVWGFRTPTKTRTLDSHASRLRRKLDPERARFVINCWGVGYRLLDG